MKRRKVLYLVEMYPQISHTYVKNEIASVVGQYEVKVLSLTEPTALDPDHFPFRLAQSQEAMLDAIKEFRPDVIHVHWLKLVGFAHTISKMTGIPYTVRSHSFDSFNVIRRGAGWKATAATIQMINESNCLGLLCFPFMHGPFLELGIDPKKLIAAPPVVATRHFYNREPNGQDILNVGAQFPAKRMEHYIWLSSQVPEKQFNLLTFGPHNEALEQFNEFNKGRVNIAPLVGFDELPAVYKRHGWLVYTACPLINTVGWPMALVEAQAAGLGICMAGIRPDLRAYVGPSAYLYDHVGQLPDIIRKPIDPARREAGFENALKMDIGLHIEKLTALWDTAPMQAAIVSAPQKFALNLNQ